MGWQYVVLILCSVEIARCQNTNTFPLVNVNDSVAGVASTTQKTYTTKVRLIATTTTITAFSPAAFQTAATAFYSTTLGGAFAVVRNIVGVAGPSSTAGLPTFDVTYNVAYSFSVLQSPPVVTDQDVTTEIGTYQAVINGITNVPGSSLNNFYVFDINPSVFTFTGSSICNAAGTNCTANTVCNETLAGVTVICVSGCKMGYCQNNGTCEQASVSVAPTCTCLSKADVWFLGSTCQTRVELWMVIVAAVLAFLLIIAAILLACCCYATKRRKKEKEADTFLVNGKDQFYTNKAYLNNEAVVKPVKVEAMPRYEERNVDAYIARRRRSRSRSTSRDRHRRRERRRSDDSSRHRRHRYYDDESSRRRHRRSNSSVSSYNSFESSDSSDEENTITNATPATSTAHRAPSSTSSSTSHDSASVGVQDAGNSPIRWLETEKSPPKAGGNKLGKIDIAARKGWMPSLGPQMFDIGSQERLDKQDTLPGYGETDI
uniref:Uncharacterized LOC100182499 n=1 Tax=Ciona intestinalis TaxID=7719 RepID=F6PX70_CIOIN|nr:uncharacterized protein LOC100182499 [Ciona intestinalis]|eukprot:XP_026694870.1 uncharacterized protein LOC100182499 [Ciona intestinalis]